jgi:hypothetical protein
MHLHVTRAERQVIGNEQWRTVVEEDQHRELLALLSQIRKLVTEVRALSATSTDEKTQNGRDASRGATASPVTFSGSSAVDGIGPSDHTGLAARRAITSVATAPREREAGRGQGARRIEAHDIAALRRAAPGGLQRPSSLPVCERPEHGRCDWPGRERLRRPLVHGLARRGGDHHRRVELRRRRQRLLTYSHTPA